MANKNNKKRVEEEVDDVMQTNNTILSQEMFKFATDIINMKADIDVEALTAEFDEDDIKNRKGGYGKQITYVNARAYRDRLNAVTSCRWSYFIVNEQKVTDPVDSYNKEKDEYFDSPAYLKVTGLLAIPGLGVQMGYGVKKTYGSNESDDWKAAATDAFKKCCAGFGIEPPYIDEDEDDDKSSSNKKGGKAKKGSIDDLLDEVEFDQDEYDEALEYEVTFGKYANLTLEEIYDEDSDYLEWLAENAREADTQEAALMVLKGKAEEEGSKKKKKSKGKDKGKSSSKSKNKSKPNKKSKKDDDDEDEDDNDEDDEEEKPAKKSKAKDNKKSKGSSKSKKEDDGDEDDEKQELINSINEVFEEEEWDEVNIQSLIASVTMSKKNPDGKDDIEDLTLKELKNLAESVLDAD